MIYVATRPGIHHEKSEDTVLVDKVLLSNQIGTFPIPKHGFVCVADGVGGNYGGACASTFLLGQIMSMSFPENDKLLRDSMTKINDLLIQKGLLEPEMQSMATTLTGIFLSENIRLLTHIGNTRAYVKQGRYLKQITQDHTVYNWLLKAGRITEAEACNKSEITNCFGGGNPALLARLHISEIGEFGQMLLTSDGVHEYVDIDLMENILNDNSSGADKCTRIINAALDCGADDDMTVVLVNLKED